MTDPRSGIAATPASRAGATAPSTDQERIRRILDARTEQLARRGTGVAGGEGAPEARSHRLLVCAAGPEAYGIDIGAVAQILPSGPCIPVPGAPAAVLGLFGRAGQVFAVVDLAAGLGLAAAASGGGNGGGEDASGGHFLLLRRAHPRRFALRVDRAVGVASVAALEHGGGAEGPAEGAVVGHALAPAGLVAPQETLLGLIDLDRFLRPFLAVSSADPGALPT